MSDSETEPESDVSLNPSQNSTLANLVQTPQHHPSQSDPIDAVHSAISTLESLDFGLVRKVSS